MTRLQTSRRAIRTGSHAVIISWLVSGVGEKLADEPHHQGFGDLLRPCAGVGRVFGGGGARSRTPARARHRQQRVQERPLVNPGNDARAVAAVLRESGFTVIERRIVNQATTRP